MKIIIEEYQYAVEDVKDILWEGAFQTVDGKVSINYVGYYFNPRQGVNDCVFILPKVLLEVGSDKVERVFGKYLPKDIVNIDKNSPLTPNEREFIYSFSVWIYRALSVYRNLNKESKIIYQRQVSMMGKGRTRKSSTLLDIILALQRFQRDNRDFFLFTVKNLHLGFNKINWTRTIATTKAVVDSGCPIYLSPINKRRIVNFDEELLVIFYSILNYIHEAFGFPMLIDMGYSLITGKKFEHYLKRFGKIRLRQIKYKYYSDLALQLWELCYAFFDQPPRVNILADRQEYLLAKNFNIVFESIIDNLVGQDNPPAGLKEQEDGKRVDHIYPYQSVIIDEPDKDVFYIGDSKYYKLGNPVGRESVYKQFTYARNVIQWNLNLFLDNPDQEAQEDLKAFGKYGKLRDDITEGYNVIPNFFISAKMLYDASGKLSYADNIAETSNGKRIFNSRQFENRLFDRDTLLVAHYDVNFLFVVSLYARDSISQKSAWKSKVRRMFREKIQEMLKDKFEFYAMTPRAETDPEQFLRDNFQLALGKVYTPYGNHGPYVYYSLALDKDQKFASENAAVNRSWILGRGKYKRTDMYNVRLGTRAGSVASTATLTRSPRFLVLYDVSDATMYSVYRIKSSGKCDKAKMLKLGYTTAQHDYYCYVLEEEVSLGDLDLSRLLADRRREQGASFKLGAPIYLKGGELISYRS